MMTREAALNNGLKNVEFLDLSPEELVVKCREYRAEAERLAECASSEMRKRYIHLVTEWSTLAQDIENGIRRSSYAQAA
jgi:hypothetical protein